MLLQCFPALALMIIYSVIAASMVITLLASIVSMMLLAMPLERVLPAIMDSIWIIDNVWPALCLPAAEHALELPLTTAKDAHMAFTWITDYVLYVQPAASNAKTKILAMRLVMGIILS